MGLASAERRRSFSGEVRRSFWSGSHAMAWKEGETGEGGRVVILLLLLFL